MREKLVSNSHSLIHSLAQQGLMEQMLCAWSWPRAHSQTAVPDGQAGRAAEPGQAESPAPAEVYWATKGARTQTGRGQHKLSSVFWWGSGEEAFLGNLLHAWCLQSLADRFACLQDKETKPGRGRLACPGSPESPTHPAAHSPVPPPGSSSGASGCRARPRRLTG